MGVSLNQRVRHTECLNAAQNSAFMKR